MDGGGEVVEGAAVPLVVYVADRAERAADWERELRGSGAELIFAPAGPLAGPLRPYVCAVAAEREAELEGLWPQPLARAVVGGAHHATPAEAWAALRNADPLNRPYVRILERTRSSDRPALRSPEGRWTHRELWGQAELGARALWALGVRRGARVTIALPLGLDWCAAVLAANILGVPYDVSDDRATKAARAHARSVWQPSVTILPGLPEDPDEAAEHPSVIMEWPRRAELAQGAAGDPELEAELRGGGGDDPATDAFIDWTTGSTGQPKGVVTRHSTLTNMLGWWWAAHPMGEGDAVCAVGLFVLWYWWMPLCMGREALLCPGPVLRDPERLASLMAEHGASRVVCLTPSLLRVLPLKPLRARLRIVVLSGEALDHGLVRSTLGELGEGATVLNLLSTSEAGDVACGAVSGLEGSGSAHVGRPIAGVRVECTAEGELVVSGAGVPPGACYLCNPEATAAAFYDSADGRRRWATKDRCAWEPSAGGQKVLRILGRLNRAVKVRGFKVDLGEVEKLLPPGAKCCVGGDRLAAFVPLDALAAEPAGRGNAVRELRRTLAAALPSWHVPWICVVTSLPRNRTGKLDGKVLAEWAERGVPAERRAPGVDGPTTNGTPAAGAPADGGDAHDAAVRAAWAQLLGGRAPEGESFFDAGGHSLLAVRLAKLLGLRAPDVWAHPTMAQQAELLRRKSADSGPSLGLLPRAAPKSGCREVAIVGAAVRWPGGATTLGAVWDALRSGRDCGTELSEAQLAAAGVPASVRRRSDYVRRAYVLPDPLVRGFDHDFWGMPRAAAERIDPAQRMALELAWEAREQGARQEKDCGVYLACGSLPHYLTDVMGEDLGRLRARDPARYFDTECGNDKDYVATRTAYHLGLTGPAVNVQTACSSGLSAVAMAVEAVREGRCRSALAGAVSLWLPQHTGYAAPEGMIWSPTGWCRPFDAAARGTVNSNGGAVFLLKPLEAAVAAGDTVLGVVSGVGMNNDGARKASFHAPSVEGQVSCLRAALADAAMTPAEVGMVECHGTGTPLGDPIEVAALAAAYAGARELALASVKGSSGHANTAAGALGLVEALLCVSRGERAPVAHFAELNPHIDLPAGFSVHQQPQPWPAERRVCGVSSFGIGGTNVHLLLRNHSASGSSSSSSSRGAPVWPPLFCISARSEAALRGAAGPLRAAAEADPEGVERALLRRTALPLRLARAGAAPDAGSAVAAAVAGRPVVLLLPGQGSQFAGMGRALMGHPVFGAAVGRCAELLGADPFEMDMDSAEAACLALFVHCYATAELLRACGVRVVAAIGHSLGQLTAAALAGTWELPAALRLVRIRGQLLDRVRGEGAMLAVGGAVDPGALPSGVELACVNAPGRSVLSGPRPLLERYAASASASCKFLRTAGAFHSAALDPVVPEWRRAVRESAPRPPRHPVGCNLVGGWLSEGNACSADYWAEQMRRCVRFGDNAALARRSFPDAAFADLGPGQLAQLARLSGCNPCVPFSRMPAPAAPAEPLVWVGALGSLWEAGVNVDWDQYLAAKYGGELPQAAPLPPYEWDRADCWPQPAGERPAAEVDPEEAEDEVASEDLWSSVEWVPAPVEFMKPGPTQQVPAWVLAGDAAALPPPFAPCRTAEEFGACAALGVAAIVAGPGGGDCTAEEATVRALEAVQAVLGAAPLCELFAVVPERPAFAGVVGLLRAVQSEYPDLRVRRCVVDPACPDLPLPLADEVRIRGGRPEVPRLRARACPGAGCPAASFEGGTYVVTGGTSGVGKEVCKMLRGSGAARVVAVSRGGVADASLAAAGVEARALDVGHTGAVEALLQELPLLQGIFHCAGIVADGAVPNWSPQRTRDALRAKVAGARAIVSAAAAKHPESFVLLFSSSSASIGPRGQSVYCAANLYEDWLAAESGPRVASVQWGGWVVGMTERHGIQPERGEAFLTVEQGLGAVRSAVAALAAGRPLPAELLAAPVPNWAAYAEAVGCSAALAAELVAAAPLLGAPRHGDGALCWERAASGADLDWVAEHVVDGEPTVPATLWLELLARAARGCFDQDPAALVLRDVQWAAPLSPSPDLRLRTTVASGDTLREITVVSLPGGTLHARCSADLAASRAGAAPPARARWGPEAAAAAELVEEGRVGAMYEGMEAAGFSYSASFRRADRLAAPRPGVALVRVTPAAWQVAAGRNFALGMHPALLDACTHGLSEVAPTGYASLPVGVGCVSISIAPQQQDAGERYGCACAAELGVLSAVVSAPGRGVLVALDDFRTAALPVPPLLVAEEAWGEALAPAQARTAGRWEVIGDAAPAAALAAALARRGASKAGALRGVVALGCGDDGLRRAAQLCTEQQQHASPALRLWCVALPSDSIATFEELTAAPGSPAATWVQLGQDADGAAAAPEELAEELAGLLCAQPASHWIAGPPWRPLAQRSRPAAEGRAPAGTAAPAPPAAATWRARVRPDPSAVGGFACSRAAGARVPPGPGELEVATDIWALNFLDVLLAAGAMSLRVGGEAATVGGECVGTVVRVGSGVDGFAVGDRVAAVAGGGMGRHALVRADFSHHVPSGMPSAEAATVGLAFATAQLACERARVRRGQCVLVHSAAGGVGLAAVELLSRQGCTVLATCSSEAKRAELTRRGVDPARIFNSRDHDDFFSGVMRATDGKGVDACFNSLAGEAMRASLRLVADNGSFVEIGKRDQMRGAQLDSSVFLRGITYTTAHLDVLMNGAPGEVRRLLGEVWRAPAPLPHKVFRFEELGEALGVLSKGTHIGKLCVCTDSDAPALEPPRLPEWAAAGSARGAAAAAAAGPPPGQGALIVADGTVRELRAALAAAAPRDPLLLLAESGAPAAEACLACARARRCAALLVPSFDAPGVWAEEAAAAWRSGGRLRLGRAPGGPAMPPLRAAALREAGAAPAAGAEAGALLDWVLGAVEGVLGRAARPDQSLSELGADSLALLQLQQRLRAKLRRTVDPLLPIRDLVGAPAPAAAAPRPPPPSSAGGGRRVLCLHGFRTNAEVFAAQLDGVAESLGVELIFLDAPHPAGGPGPGRSSGGREWWGGVRDTSYESGWCDPAGLRGTAESAAALADAAARLGPFDGIIGFSQGAAAALALLSAAAPPPRWAALLSPVRWPAPLPPPAPACRVCVAWDPAEELASEAAALAAELQAAEIRHTRGHAVPPASDGCWGRIADLLRWEPDA